MGIDNQVEHADKVELFSLEELDNHFVKLDNFELNEVPDVPPLDNLVELEIDLLYLEIREKPLLTLPC